MLVNTAFKTLPEFMKSATSPVTSLHFDNFVEPGKSEFSPLPD
jgi:hypothetical protein